MHASIALSRHHNDGEMYPKRWDRYDDLYVSDWLDVIERVRNQRTRDEWRTSHLEDRMRVRNCLCRYPAFTAGYDRVKNVAQCHTLPEVETEGSTTLCVCAFCICFWHTKEEAPTHLGHSTDLHL